MSSATTPEHRNSAVRICSASSEWWCDLGSVRGIGFRPGIVPGRVQHRALKADSGAERRGEGSETGTLRPSDVLGDSEGTLRPLDVRGDSEGTLRPPDVREHIGSISYKLSWLISSRALILDHCPVRRWSSIRARGV